MLALTATTGKIGGAVLSALLTHKLIPANEVVICTSSDPDSERWTALKAQGGRVRHANFADPASMRAAFAGCAKLLLVSSPDITLDFFDAPAGHGREKHHIAAIEAARAAGVAHIFYTSLAFGAPASAAGVMRAHLRTEAHLRQMKGTAFTIIREGLYNESWPLYLGYYYDFQGDDRREIVVAGDGPVSWTAVADLGYATALVLVDTAGRYEGAAFYLSAPTTRTLADIAQVVAAAKGYEVKIKEVDRDEYCRHYVEEKGRDKDAVEWWASTYEALRKGECKVRDSTLSNLLVSRGVRLKPVEETVREMLLAGE
ncbi:MAG: hypothetical protein M1819_002454 [Sarea resinae]|nr:MAG: hypothetical protein M1819_002454 [Sarea resinae]